MKEQVFWFHQREPAVARELRGEVHADVVIVGGGMAGLSCARRLLGSGLSIVVVESDFCGSGASGRSSGFVTPASEIELSSLISTHGPDEARRLWDFVLSGVEAIRSSIEEHTIDCDYQPQDSFSVANGRFGRRRVQAEHDARTQLGYSSRLYERKAVREVIGTSRYAGAVRYGGTFGIDGHAYCRALRDLLELRGARIHERSPVTRVRKDGVDTAAGSVRAKHVVVCADRFIPDLGALRSEIYHVQTFLGISRPIADADMARVFASDRVMTWDTDLIYHYFRAAGRDRILVGGGDLAHTYAEKQATSMARNARRLTAYFQSRFPDVALELEYVWPGMLGVSKDLLPVMGVDEQHDTVWYAGAATGLPWAAALGIYAAERILGKRNELDETLSWRRTFKISPSTQALLTKPVSFAICNGIAKYS